jgi:linoleoyl-CoA desaturase
MAVIKYHQHDVNLFFTEVRARSEKMFEANGKTRFGGRALYWKTGFWLGIYWVFYALILAGWLSFPFSLLLWMAFGFSMLLISLNIGHDASHGSFSPNKHVNRIFAYVFELIGTSSYLWGIMHNKAHHGYVNLHANDVAIQTEPMLRLSEEAPLYPWHRFQHLYGFGLYSISTLFWVLLKDFKFISKPRIGPFETRPHPWQQIVSLVIFKLLYFGYIVFIPCWVAGIPIGHVLLGFLVMHLTMGITLGLTFQTTHAVEETLPPRWRQFGVIDNPWAIHILESTSDFNTQSRMLNFLFGGLNTHVAHHLFPQYAHVHYPAISKIIREVAAEQGLPYVENKSMWVAAWSHIKYLKYLGNKEPITVPQEPGREHPH